MALQRPRVQHPREMQTGLWWLMQFLTFREYL